MRWTRMRFKGALITVAAPLIQISKDIFSNASVVVDADILTGAAQTFVTNILCNGVVAEIVSPLTFSIARLSQWLTRPITKLKVSC
jgi:hypothetical protein